MVGNCRGDDGSSSVDNWVSSERNFNSKTAYGTGWKEAGFPLFSDSLPGDGRLTVPTCTCVSVCVCVCVCIHRRGPLDVFRPFSRQTGPIVARDRCNLKSSSKVFSLLSLYILLPLLSFLFHSVFLLSFFSLPRFRLITLKPRTRVLVLIYRREFRISVRKHDANLELSVPATRDPDHISIPSVKSGALILITSFERVFSMFRSLFSFSSLFLLSVIRWHASRR